jgi:beta-glucosidase
MLRRRSLLALALLCLTAACGFAAVLGGSATARADSTACPWLDKSKSPDQRAQMLLAAMTLDDKIAIVHGDNQIFTYYGVAGHVPANSRLCIPELLLNDAGQGVGDGQTNTTAFPAPIAQASSWDPTLQRQFGDALGWETWHKGINIMLAPDVNIARVPMNGRNFEAFGEDPYLSGQTGAAVINGIQGEHVIATVKHYAGNNQETNRNSVSSDIDERTLHEIYMPAFETAVKQGGVGAVMCSYNLVNSIYACEQPTLLTSILKNEFGFGGFVMSDWGATHSTAPAANAGLDMEMFQDTYFGAALKTAVQSGQVPLSRLNDMVTRILSSMFRIGVFDDPAAAEPNAYVADVERTEDITLARKLSEDGTVLLKNAGGVLPLSGQGKKIAVIGPTAGPAGVQNVYNGSGSSHIPEAGGKADVVSPLQGIQQRALGNGDAVVYADGSSTADAVAAATASDVAVVFAGQEDSEGVDRANLQNTYTICQLVACTTLPIDQDKLISSVAAANPNTIVVLNTGGPVLMPWVDQVKGILEAWYPGQEDGNAIAALLFGDVNPSAKLPETFPRSQGDLPTRTQQQYPGVNGHAVYSEGLDVGYHWYDAKSIKPLYPFGHGLSYTTFGYGGLSLKASSADTVFALFSLKNTGSRAGAEVAQVYVSDPSSAGEPPQQLKGFQKVYLQPGESRSVGLTLEPRAFAVWDTGKHTWIVPGGTYKILVGSSSRDIRLQGTVNLMKKVLGP